MNDLIPVETLPAIAGGLSRLKAAYDDVHTWEDIENVFLRNQGLSPNTYRNYISAVRRFYDFTNGLHPFQWEPYHLERYYEHRREEVSPGTASIDMSGIKNFCNKISSKYPYQSPFERLTEETRQKLFKHELGDQKQALNLKELETVLRTVDSLNYVIIRYLVTTGLRAAEAVNARFEQVFTDDINNRTLLAGTGKGKNGGKKFTVELDPVVIKAMKVHFEDVKGRPWKTGDTLLVTSRGTKFTRSTLWARLNAAGIKLKESGSIRKDLEFSPHLFRRTFATLQLQAGRSQAEVQKSGRWSNAETMLRHYHDYQGGTVKFMNENIFSRMAI